MAFLKDDNLYDVIVVGVGSMGSATCYYLAKSGLNVIGIDQFKVPHESGSHTGESRFSRMAYFEHPDYVPLLQASYNNWDHLEEQTREKHFHKTGIVYFGKPESDQISGVRKSAKIYDLSVHEISLDKAKEEYPQFQLEDSFETILEPNAGYVKPEQTITSYVKLAKLNGAKIVENQRILEWNKDNGTFIVVTQTHSYKAKKIVFTAGGWTQHLIADLVPQLQVTQQCLAWIRPEDQDLYQEGTLPCWSVSDPAYKGMFYGFPIFDGSNQMMKLAYHDKGIEKPADLKNTLVSDDELAPLTFFLKKYMPQIKADISKTATCLYNYSTDEDFIIDFLPEYDKDVIIACGFSGHGFKFVPVIGEVLRDLVVEGITELPIEFLKMRSS